MFNVCSSCLPITMHGLTAPFSFLHSKVTKIMDTMSGKKSVLSDGHLLMGLSIVAACQGKNFKVSPTNGKPKSLTDGFDSCRMSDYGGEQGPTMTTGLPFQQTPDFFSRYITKNATEIQINGSPIQLLKTPSNTFDGSRSNGLTPPPLAFSPSPTKFTEDGSAALNSSFCHSLNVDECVAFLDQVTNIISVILSYLI